MTGPATVGINAQQMQARLEHGLQRHGVPGAVLGLLQGTRVTTVAAGVASLRTGVPTSPETLFQVGSITKLYTACLVMQLVDEGSVNLDTPVQEYLPGFALADDSAAARVTPRHLLAHTSGIDADLRDCGRGDDCLERYVEGLRDAQAKWPPGEAFSYCNAGYIVLGRMVEVVRGYGWDEVLRRHLVQPLGLRHTVTLPEEVLLHSAAVGHSRESSGSDLAVAGTWGMTRSCGPAGLICASAADVCAFVAALVGAGKAGTILSDASIAEMQRIQVGVSVRDNFVGQGLGWGVCDWNGSRVLAHDGGTIGQLSFLRVVPEAGVAAVMLTNGPSKPLFSEMFAWLMAEAGGVEMPPAPQPVDGAVGDLSALAGHYRSGASVLKVELASDRLRAKWLVDAAATVKGDSFENWTELRPVNSATFLVPEPRNGGWAEIVFFGSAPGGGRQGVYIAGRAALREMDNEEGCVSGNS
ncbi:MAG: serine hydrolase domain-containing protein [Candidatus Dormibacteria bacterium]